MGKGKMFLGKLSQTSTEKCNMVATGRETRSSNTEFVGPSLVNLSDHFYSRHKVFLSYTVREAGLLTIVH